MGKLSRYGEARFVPPWNTHLHLSKGRSANGYNVGYNRAGWGATNVPPFI
jgi:hypothetical protein